MVDHLTFELSLNGYNTCKLVPYGKYDEVLYCTVLFNVLILNLKVFMSYHIVGTPVVIEEAARELRRPRGYPSREVYTAR
jgi:hypothetical protein